MNKYVFKKSSKEFPLLFAKEKRKLTRILPKNSKVKHFGSTAVPNLGGKGIIDIIISVKKPEIKKANKSLQKAGYTFKPNSGSKEREYFEKDYSEKEKKRRVHIHLTYHNSFEFIRAVALTSYLKKHPKATKEYSEVKKKAVKFARGEGKKYKEYKCKILDKLGKLALKEFMEITK